MRKLNTCARSTRALSASAKRNTERHLGAMPGAQISPTPCAVPAEVIDSHSSSAAEFRATSCGRALPPPPQDPDGAMELEASIQPSASRCLCLDKRRPLARETPQLTAARCGPYMTVSGAIIFEPCISLRRPACLFLSQEG